MCCIVVAALLQCFTAPLGFLSFKGADVMHQKVLQEGYDTWVSTCIVLEVGVCIVLDSKRLYYF